MDLHPDPSARADIGNLHAGDSATAAVMRMLIQGVAQAQSALNPSQGIAGAQDIHAARKAIRNTRAALRLVAPALGTRVSEELSTALRSAGHDLAPLRDQQALLERANQWLPQEPSVLAPVRATLEAAVRRSHDQLGRVVRSVRQRLAAVQTVLHAQRVHAHWRDLIAGHLQTQRRARSAWHQVLQDRSEEGLHRWRRRGKDLRQQLHLLEPVFPDVLKGWARGWERLSDTLGDHRDLGMLLVVIDAQPGAGALSAALVHRREDLEDQAVTLGRRLHALTPDAQGRLLRRYLRLWRTDGPST